MTIPEVYFTVELTISFAFDVTRNPAEFDDFNFVHCIYFV